LFLLAVLSLTLPLPFLLAVKEASPERPFSIQLSKEWMELDLPFQGVIASYGRKGTLATFHITERKLDDIKTVGQLKWKDLFNPEFESIEIHKQGDILLAGEKARFCIYSLRPGDFKKKMEGKLAAKYINYVLIHQGRLFSITFKDTEDGFALNYPSFLTAIRTFHFNEPASLGRKR